MNYRQQKGVVISNLDKQLRYIKPKKVPLRDAIDLTNKMIYAKTDYKIAVPDMGKTLNGYERMMQKHKPFPFL